MARPSSTPLAPAPSRQRGAGSEPASPWIRPAHQRRSQRVLEAILDATLRLLNEKPFDEIRVLEICERASCSPPSFYRRFRDKEALLHAVHERHVAFVVEGVRRLLGPECWENRSLSEVIRHFVHGMIEVESQVTGLRITATRRAAADPRFAERIREIRSAVFSGLHELLQARCSEHGQGDPEAAAGFLVRLVTGSAFNYFEYRDIDEPALPLTRQGLERQLTRAVQSYLGTTPDAAVPRDGGQG